MLVRLQIYVLMGVEVVPCVRLHAHTRRLSGVGRMHGHAPILEGFGDRD